MVYDIATKNHIGCIGLPYTDHAKNIFRFLRIEYLIITGIIHNGYNITSSDGEWHPSHLDIIDPTNLTRLEKILYEIEE